MSTTLERVAARYSDPVLAIAKDILTENKDRDVAVPWFTNEVYRRYIGQGGAHDEHLEKYLKNGGLGGLARRLLKRSVRIEVRDETLKVPERVRIGPVYRPTLLLTADELDRNTRSKRRAISFDVRAVKPLERLAELMHEAKVQRVSDIVDAAEEDDA